MEYDAYRRKFNDWLTDHGSIGAHAEFVIKPLDSNPRFQSSFSKAIELVIQKWIRQPAPGIKYQRNGNIFKVDIVAIGNDPVQLNYFRRALYESYPIKSHIRTLSYQPPSYPLID